MNDIITAAVAAGFPGAEIAVDVDGNRAQITVVSPVFATMTRVRKQQAVYACIAEHIASGALHAVTIRALTPEEAG